MFTEVSSSNLITDNQVEAWVRATFGAQLPEGDGVRVVVKIDGRSVGEGRDRADTSDDATRAAIRELTRSLSMYSGVAVPFDAQVTAPPAETVRRAVRALTDGTARRKTLGAALGIFGRRVIGPIEQGLTSGRDALAPRVAAWRARVRASVGELRLSRETSQVLIDDLDKLLTDAYLATVVEYEEKAVRPRLTELAHRVLDVLAETFHRALDRFGANAAEIADRVVRNLPATMAIRDVPSRLRAGFVVAMADFLQVETSAHLVGALTTLSNQYSDVVPPDAPLAFDDEWYKDLAAECWSVIEAHG